MPLTVGVRLGAYEVTGVLGAGGMGEVYRARDTRLKRDVALKVLPDSFAADPDRLARFQREAEVLASLNHPHIAAIHGLEESGDTRALVLELVEGETLADRIARGPIPVDEALPMAMQIAEALETAHEQGIIHRDLKPANIKLTSEGAVKVLDFGLAKLADGAATASSGALSMSPTITSPAMMTGAGVVLGTAAYMAPEQAKGRPADKRSDVWAFGCVLFEMLSGRAPFKGEDVTDILAAVVRGDPDWQRIPEQTPAHVVELVKGCLIKDRRQRVGDLSVARFVLAKTGSASPGLREKGAPSRSTIAAVVMVVAALLIAAGAWVYSLRAVPGGAVTAFTVPPPETTTFTIPAAANGIPRLAVSPDGSRLAFVALEPDGHQRIWLRALDDPVAGPLMGTDGADAPFWSADGSRIGFFAQGEVRFVGLNGGAPQALGKSTRAYGGAWSNDGVVLFSSLRGQGLTAVWLDGSRPPATVTTVDTQAGQADHGWPDFLPDGNHFLFSAIKQGGTGSDILVGALDGSAPRRLMEADANVRYVAPGYVLFARRDAWYAQRFDVDTLALSGTPVQLTRIDATNGPQGYTGLSGARTGVPVIAYATAPPTSGSITWRTRDGVVISTSQEEDIAQLSLSPDGRRVAARRNTAPADIWLFDVGRDGPLRLNTRQASSPIWSHDGQWLTFRSGQDGVLDEIFVRNLRAPVSDRKIAAVRGSIPDDWSPDGRFVVFHTATDSPADAWDIRIADARTGEVRPLLSSAFNEIHATFSPDGRYLSYASDESGVFEVYVQPYPATGEKWRISTRGGSEPRWRRDGRELYYVSPDRRMMSVPISVAPALDVGAPAMLFQTAMRDMVLPGTRRYDVSRDGSRFVMTEQSVRTSSLPLTVIVNWPARLAP